MSPLRNLILKSKVHAIVIRCALRLIGDVENRLGQQFPGIRLCDCHDQLFICEKQIQLIQESINCRAAQMVLFHCHQHLRVLVIIDLTDRVPCSPERPGGKGLRICKRKLDQKKNYDDNKIDPEKGVHFPDDTEKLPAGSQPVPGASPAPLPRDISVF